MTVPHHRSYYRRVFTSVGLGVLDTDTVKWTVLHLHRYNQFQEIYLSNRTKQNHPCETSVLRNFPSWKGQYPSFSKPLPSSRSLCGVLFVSWVSRTKTSTSFSWNSVPYVLRRLSTFSVPSSKRGSRRSFLGRDVCGTRIRSLWTQSANQMS